MKERDEEEEEEDYGEKEKGARIELPCCHQ